MNPEKNIDEVLHRYITSAKQEDVEAHCDQVFQRLETRARDVHTPARTVRPVWRLLWAGLAAAAIVFAVLIPIAMRPPVAATLEIAARNVRFGEAVRSEMFGEIVKLEDGSHVEMKTNSELVLERADDGVRIRLNQGDIVVNAAKQHGHLYVQTKDVSVSVVGTVFYVKAEKEGSRVAVFEGEVRVKQGATERKLGPGEQVASNPKMETIPVKEQVAWSREAAPHLAVLSQAPAPQRLAFEEAAIRPAAVNPPVEGPNVRSGSSSGRGRPECGETVGLNPVIQLDPRRFNARDVSLFELVALAYGRCVDLRNFGRLSGGPDWIKSAGWDIEAVISEGSLELPPVGFLAPSADLWGGRSPKVQKMIRTLLEERFKVVVRRETKEMPVYVLTVAPGGTKFQGPAKPNPNMPPGAMFGFTGADGKLYTPAEGASATMISGTARCDGNPCVRIGYNNVYMSEPVNSLAGRMGRPVVDRTGIQDRVSFAIEWPRDPGYNAQTPLGPPLSFGAMNKVLEAVGLQLKEDPKGQVEVLVVDSAEKPSEN
jgi:uncharacterized protein (TIGR03435 family)